MSLLDWMKKMEEKSKNPPSPKVSSKDCPPPIESEKVRPKDMSIDTIKAVVKRWKEMQTK